MTKKNALGRGLSALISNDKGDVYSEDIMDNVSNINDIDICDIVANSFQPRTQFDKEALDELANSIKQIGIVQPITVREISNDKFQIIAGERRYRAAGLIGLNAIPAYVRVAADDDMLELSLVENIQRENLDAIEVAIAFQRLIDECSLTQEKLSEKVGKKRTTVTNYLRLLKLPAEIQLGVRDKKISMGHARALLGIEDRETQLMLFDKIIIGELSVRKIEELVREINNPAPVEKNENNEASDSEKLMLNEDFKGLQTKLANLFSSKVKLKCSKEGNGKIVIPFKSNEDLERILTVFEDIK
ncbi:MAG: ParB/RepB/Spo0J family partition protein [Marinifilaceae bacterium]